MFATGNTRKYGVGNRPKSTSAKRNVPEITLGDYNAIAYACVKNIDQFTDDDQTVSDEVKEQLRNHVRQCLENNNDVFSKGMDDNFKVMFLSFMLEMCNKCRDFIESKDNVVVPYIDHANPNPARANPFGYDRDSVLKFWDNQTEDGNLWIANCLTMYFSTFPTIGDNRDICPFDNISATGCKWVMFINAYWYHYKSLVTNWNEQYGWPEFNGSLYNTFLPPHCVGLFVTKNEYSIKMHPSTTEFMEFQTYHTSIEKLYCSMHTEIGQSVESIAFCQSTRRWDSHGWHGYTFVLVASQFLFFTTSITLGFYLYTTGKANMYDEAKYYYDDGKVGEHHYGTCAVESAVYETTKGMIDIGNKLYVPEHGMANRSDANPDGVSAFTRRTLNETNCVEPLVHFQHNTNADGSGFIFDKKHQARIISAIAGLRHEVMANARAAHTEMTSHRYLSEDEAPIITTVKNSGKFITPAEITSATKTAIMYLFLDIKQLKNLALFAMDCKEWYQTTTNPITKVPYTELARHVIAINPWLAAGWKISARVFQDKTYSTYVLAWWIVHGKEWYNHFVMRVRSSHGSVSWNTEIPSSFQSRNDDGAMITIHEPGNQNNANRKSKRSGWASVFKDLANNDRGHLVDYQSRHGYVKLKPVGDVIYVGWVYNGHALPVGSRSNNRGTSYTMDDNDINADYQDFAKHLGSYI